MSSISNFQEDDNVNWQPKYTNFTERSISIIFDIRSVQFKLRLVASVKTTQVHVAH